MALLSTFTGYITYSWKLSIRIERYENILFPQEGTAVLALQCKDLRDRKSFICYYHNESINKMQAYKTCYRKKINNQKGTKNNSEISEKFTLIKYSVCLKLDHIASIL